MLRRSKELSNEVVEGTEVVEEPIVEETDEETTEAEVMDSTVATDSLTKAVETAREELKFVGDFAVVGYKRKPASTVVDLSGTDFDLSITIKDNSKWGI